MKATYWLKAKRTTILALADLLVLGLSALLSFLPLVDLLYAGSFLPPSFLWLWLLANALFAAVIFSLAGLYSMPLRTAGTGEVLRILLSMVAITLFNIVFALFSQELAAIQIILFLLIWSVGMVVCRLAIRFYRLILFGLQKKSGYIRVMVVGAGSAGELIIREMKTSDKIRILPVCVIDDDPKKQHTRINGVPVVGTRAAIPSAVKRYAVQRIFVAMPAVSPSRVHEIYEICVSTGVRVQILPGIYQMLNDTVLMSRTRDVSINDLLGREQIRVNNEEILRSLCDRVVMVTGGGGSIGSELCRQIAAHSPKRLVIFDIYENNAYDVEQEIRRKHPELDLHVLIGSVRDAGRVRAVFEKERPSIVFHAAAHKHVPLMETSPHEAIKNNVFGTLNVAQAAEEYGVDRFVLISTDKAVNPTNVMGATKRICEMIVQDLARRSKHTDFVAVRFGNVLGSNGSVIPLFKKQIEQGGPVTVTHRDIVRFFMTIPEAVSLVLQAGALAKGGEIFVLDMGKPVKILKLAENLIRLSGYKPYEEIAIEFTGLRPGEKLYEELLMDEEGMKTTDNKMIHIGRPIDFDGEELHRLLGELKVAMHGNEDIRPLIRSLVSTYHYEDAPAAQVTV